MKCTIVVLVCLTAALSQSVARAGLALAQNDSDPTTAVFTDNGALDASEYAATFANGGGNGFGGTVGGGSIYMDSDSTNIYFGFDPGADLNDYAVLYLDTRAGGVLDANMNDHADGSRWAASSMSRDSNDVFPIVPDFALVFSQFGTVVFELTTHAGNESTSTDGHLQFHVFQNDQSGTGPSVVREISLSRTLLGNPQVVDFFVGYSSGDGFSSNESLPGSALNSLVNNPGYGSVNGTVTYDNFNRFTVSAVPEISPAAAIPVAITISGALGIYWRRLRSGLIS